MRLTPAKKKKFLKNLLVFTAPILVVLFGQLAMGSTWEASAMLAVYALYAALKDLFSKIK